MKLITEEIESVEVLTETVNGKKTLYIQGPFLQTETTNRNNRRYGRVVMEREVKRYTENYICKGRALGELGHPDGPTVNLDRVSHKIVSLTAEGTNFIGKAQLLETPMGKIAKSLIGEGVCLGVSSRGVGSLKMLVIHLVDILLIAKMNKLLQDLVDMQTYQFFLFIQLNILLLERVV